METSVQPAVVAKSPSRQKIAPAPEKSTAKAGVGNTTGSGSSKKEKKPTTANASSTDGNTAVEGVKEKTKDTKEAKKAKDEMTIDDLLLPRTLISRLSRGSLPPNTSLQKDALLALTKSATVFISYLAHTANSLTSRKTIQADDILKAISELEFDGVMRERLEKEIQLFEEGVRGKRKGYRDRVKARESGVSQMDGIEVEEGTGEHVHKRIKRSAGDDDVDMGGVSDLKKPNATHDQAGVNEDGEDEDDDDPSAQLLAEASRAAGHKDVDETESERDEDDDEEEDDAVDDDDDEDEDNDDDDGGEAEDDDDDEGEEDKRGLEDRDDMTDRKKSRQYLAPDGRAEVDGSDNESD